MKTIKTAQARYTLGYHIQGDRLGGKKPVYFETGIHKPYRKNSSPYLSRVGFRSLSDAVLAQEDLERDLAHNQTHPEFERGTSRIHKVEADLDVVAVKIDDFMALRDKSMIAEIANNEDFDIQLTPAEIDFLKNQNVSFNGRLEIPFHGMPEGFSLNNLGYLLETDIFDLGTMSKADLERLGRAYYTKSRYVRDIDIDGVYKEIHGVWQKQSREEQPKIEYIWFVRQSLFENPEPIRPDEFEAIFLEEALAGLSIEQKSSMDAFKSSDLPKLIEEKLKAPFSHKRQNKTFAPRVKHERGGLEAEHVADSIKGAADLRVVLKTEFGDKAADIRPVEINSKGIELTISQASLLREYLNIIDGFSTDENTYEGLAKQMYLEDYPKSAEVIKALKSLQQERNDGFWIVTQSQSGKKATKNVEISSQGNSLESLLKNLATDNNEHPIQIMYCTVTFGSPVPEKDVQQAIFDSLTEKFEGRGSAGSAMRAIGHETGLAITDQSGGLKDGPG